MTASREITRTSLDDLTSVRVDCGLVPDDPAIAAELVRVVDKLEALIGAPTVDVALRAYTWRAQARKPRELRLEVRVPSDLQSIYRAPYYPGEDAEAATWRMVRVVVVLADVRRHVAEVWSSEARDLTMAAEWYRRGHWRLLRA